MLPNWRAGIAGPSERRDAVHAPTVGVSVERNYPNLAVEFCCRNEKSLSTDCRWEPAGAS